MFEDLDIFDKKDPHCTIQICHVIQERPKCRKHPADALLSILSTLAGGKIAINYVAGGVRRDDH